MSGFKDWVDQLPEPQQTRVVNGCLIGILAFIVLVVALGIATCHQTDYEQAVERCENWHEAQFISRGRTPGFDGWTAIHARCAHEAEIGLWGEPSP